MEIVIKIPDDVYTRLFDNGIQDNEIAVDDICEMARAIRLGTPLEAQPCEDCISREAVLGHICEDKECYKEECKGRTLKRCPDLQWVFDLPSVTPRTNLAETSQDCISREAVQDLISSWLSDYLLDEIREALETINYKVGDMPSVYPERPKPDMIERIKKSIDEMTEIHSDGEFYIKNVDAKWIIGKYLYGAEMHGGREE